MGTSLGLYYQNSSDRRDDSDNQDCFDGETYEPEVRKAKKDEYSSVE